MPLLLHRPPDRQLSSPPARSRRLTPGDVRPLDPHLLAALRAVLASPGESATDAARETARIMARIRAVGRRGAGEGAHPGP